MENINSLSPNHRYKDQNVFVSDNLQDIFYPVYVCSKNAWCIQDRQNKSFIITVEEMEKIQHDINNGCKISDYKAIIFNDPNYKEFGSVEIKHNLYIQENLKRGCTSKMKICFSGMVKNALFEIQDIEECVKSFEYHVKNDDMYELDNDLFENIDLNKIRCVITDLHNLVLSLVQEKNTIHSVKKFFLSSFTDKEIQNINYIKDGYVTFPEKRISPLACSHQNIIFSTKDSTVSCADCGVVFNNSEYKKYIPVSGGKNEQ